MSTHEVIGTAFRLLTLLSLPRVGPATVRKLVSGASPHAFESVASAYLSRFSSSQQLTAADEAHRILANCTSLGVWVLTFLDDEYPARLRDLTDYPPVLYGKGSLRALSRRCVAVVGTRNASELGRLHAEKIAATLVEQQCTIVSGLARGIDTAAHRGALNAKGTTIAVLAHGLDTIAPVSNTELAAEIVSSGGTLLSEHPPGVPPYPPEFVRRNRIQSGMSVASIMVESGFDGGSIHQARFTYDQRRALFAWLPPESTLEQHEFHAEGALRVHQEFGAVLLRGRESLVRAIEELPQ